MLRSLPVSLAYRLSWDVQMQWIYPTLASLLGVAQRAIRGMYILEMCRLQLRKSHLMRTLSLPRRLSSMLDFQQNRLLIQNCQ